MCNYVSASIFTCFSLAGRGMGSILYPSRVIATGASLILNSRVQV
jgi:hypothetical protein